MDQCDLKRVTATNVVAARQRSRKAIPLGIAVIAAGLLEIAALSGPARAENPASQSFFDRFWNWPVPKYSPIKGDPNYQLGKSAPLGPFGYHLLKYEDDFSWLRNASKWPDFTDYTDPIKYIPLNAKGDMYVTINGEERFRNTDANNKNFNIAKGVAGGNFIYTSPVNLQPVELYRFRTDLGVDLHVTDNFRAYAEVLDAQSTGRQGGQFVAANNRNDLAFVQGFAEPMGIIDTPFGPAKVGARLGRQEIILGSNYTGVVGTDFSAPLPAPRWDAARTYIEWGNNFRSDVFYGNFVVDTFVNGRPFTSWDDSKGNNLWGWWNTIVSPKYQLFGLPAQTIFEPFYVGYRALPQISDGLGGGLYYSKAMWNGKFTSPGFATAEDHREDIGFQLSGALGAFDTHQGWVLQGGSWAGLTVRAWSIQTDTGYTFKNLPFEPRVGVHIDAASGGVHKNADGTGTISTYQPLYANTSYYVDNLWLAPTNFYDISPLIEFGLIPRKLTLELAYRNYWRMAANDAVYSGLWEGGVTANSYPLTALTPGRKIGTVPTLAIRYTPVPHLYAQFELAYFSVGPALSNAGAVSQTYVDTRLTYYF